MSNKIVQLIDNEDNNIYPVAGSLAQGSVTTSTINDGAVTYSKIDYTTMKNATIEEVSQTIGYGVNCTFRRLGNIVIASVDNVVNSTLPTIADNSPLTETVPSGFRPAYSTSLNLAIGAVATRAGNVSYLFAPNGEIHLNVAHSGDAGQVRLNGVSIWFTTDNYPTNQVTA